MTQPLQSALQAEIRKLTGKTTQDFNGDLHDLCSYYGIPMAPISGRAIGVAKIFRPEIDSASAALNYLQANATQVVGPGGLFANGEPGVWYDPSDSTTLFSDPAGTTPVAQPGAGAQVVVGLMLDKSQGLALGTQYTPGGFVDPSLTWDVFTATTNGFSATKSTAGGTDNAYSAATVVTVLGAWYKIEIDVSSITLFNFFSSLSFGYNARSTQVTFTASGAKTYVAYVQANVASGTFSIRVGTTSLGSITVDAVRVAELPGNHAISYNSTTARPELSARVNLLNATATLSTQSVTTVAINYTLYFTGTGSITLSGTATGSYNAGTHTITCTAGTLTLTVSGTVSTADLRPANSGALLPVYQAVVSTYSYDAAGFPYYLRFDGVDDGMSTPANLNLSSTDKATVFAGVRKLSNSGAQVISELSATVGSNNGSFATIANVDAAGNTTAGAYGGLLKGTTAFIGADALSLNAPISNVVTQQMNIAAALDAVVFRIDGVQVDTSGGASAGTGNFGTYPLYIGSRNNASLRLNGNIYSLIVRGAATDASTISATETWIGNKTGIVVP